MYPAPNADVIERSQGRLRIAWAAEAPLGQPIDPAVMAAREATVDLLQGLCHLVMNTRIEAELPGLYAAARPLAGANVAAGMRRMTDPVGREPEPNELEPLTWALMIGGRGVSGADALHSAQERACRQEAC